MKYFENRHQLKPESERQRGQRPKVALSVSWPQQLDSKTVLAHGRTVPAPPGASSVERPPNMNRWRGGQVGTHRASRRWASRSSFSTNAGAWRASTAGVMANTSAQQKETEDGQARRDVGYETTNSP